MSLPAIALLLSLMGPVELRGQPEPIPGTVTEVTLEGVRVSLGPGQDQLIGWDRVRRITGDHAGEAALFMDYADASWRARTRLQRGDFLAAEPLFEELFAVYEGRTGPTASLVAEGLTRARLHRGALTSAVGPWLALIHAQRGGGSDPLTSRPLVDPGTGLIPVLAPMFLDGPETRALAESELIDFPSSGPVDAAEAFYARWYQLAAQEETTGIVELALPETQDPGQRLVAAIVLARAGTPVQRKAARAILEPIAQRGQLDWMRSWAWAGLGRSLVLESDRTTRLRGVIALLHLPAEYASDQPYLAGLCLAQAAVTLDELAMNSQAQRLILDLQDRFPGHPALDWPPLRSLISTQPDPLATASAISQTDLASSTLPSNGP